jgi:4-oxalocrotonate tautomerase
MPYVNIKITNEGASSTQKAALISGVTEVLVGVLGKDPATTFVVIDEVETEHWGIGGLPVESTAGNVEKRHDRADPGSPLGRSASNGGAWRGRA